AAALSPPWNVPLKVPADYRWIGTAVPRVDLHDKVTGSAVYGLDARPEGVLTALVARIPEMAATLSGFSTAAAQTVPGVRGFVELPYGVAVVADHFWAASRAAKLIELDWEPGPLADADSAVLLERHKQQFDRSEPDYVRSDGDPAAAVSGAAQVVEAEYVVPYLAHATMEPLSATVHVRDDSADVWVASQTPDMAQNIVAEIAGLPRDQVAVHTTYIGGGFGRRVLWDYVMEAVLVAREFSVPVKTMWTREDDIRHGYSRQQTVHRLRAGLNDSGAVQGWEHAQVATPTARALMGPTMRTLLPESLEVPTRQRIGEWLSEASVKLVAAFQAREGAHHLDYAIPDMSFLQYSHDPGVPVSIWRSVGSSYNAFVVESFIDELAAAAGTDPAAYRRNLLTDPRHIAVLDKVLELAGWGDAPEGRAQGVAFFKSFESIVAQVAEVSVTGRSDTPVQVHRFSCVIDCGRAITPDIVRQQMESGIIFGLTAALYGELTIADGRIQQSNFHDYRMLRMADAPAIDVHVMPSELEPTGVGEPGVPPVAPAVANALFALTGKRIRTLPLTI
ncbi:MAG: molybdopterin-dependent oxidoreductase, partial [Gammaproteobacteria bacterium]|nr:molybdopterin-dependent oxidoreductase [Gammaproteobacteria bacterium]